MEGWVVHLLGDLQEEALEVITPESAGVVVGSYAMVGAASLRRML